MRKKGLVERTLNRFGFFKRGQELGWQAAAINRLTSNWSTQTLAADSQLRAQLATVRARCRILADQNDYAVKFLRMVKNNVVGPDGIQLKNKAIDPPSPKQPRGKLDVFANKLIEDAWWRFSQFGECTTDRTLSMCDLQNVVIETVARDGAVLLRKVRGFDNKAKFALQLIEIDHLDIEKNEMLSGGREIRMGVELNAWRQPVAYWLRKRHPNDTSYTGMIFDEWERVPASDIIHPFIRLRPGQTREVPWMASAAYRMNMLGKYEEAEVTASRAAASKMAFLIKANGNPEYAGELQDNAKMMDAEPGAIEELPHGMDLKVLDWNHPNSSYQAFMKTCLRGVAAGLGVSYNMLANDMQSVNFASGKLGLEEERDFWKCIQRWFYENVIDLIFRDWLEVQLMTQSIPLPFSKFDKFNAPDWRCRRWSYINPQQEVNARLAELNAGLNSVSRILSEKNLDRDELFAEIAEDRAAAEALGLHFEAVVTEKEEEVPEVVEEQDD